MHWSGRKEVETMEKKQMDFGLRDSDEFHREFPFLPSFVFLLSSRLSPCGYFLSLPIVLLAKLHSGFLQHFLISD
jgi:hypothetical protein